MFGPPQYEHTQTGWIRWLMYSVAMGMLIALYFIPANPPLQILLPALAGFFVVMAFIFGDLTVRDENEELVIEFGPLHFIRKRVPYAEILNVSITQTTLSDGWGIHRCARGWLWNISGFDCVQLDLKSGSRLLVGTDEPYKLMEFLRSRITAA